MNRQARRWKWSLVRIVLGLLFFFAVSACVLRQPVWTRRPLSPATADPKRLQEHVRFLSEQCHPRHYLAHENQAKALAYIEAKLREAGGRVERQAFPTSSGTFENVVAHFGPETGPRYVVGAHFDSCGPQPGADDNASGVAGLLELAALLGKETALPAHFELVAYNLEEPPFFAGPHMGSAVHARRLKEAKADVALMLSLEMIGYFRDEPDSQSYPAPLMGLMYPSRANYIAIVGKLGQRSVVGRFKAACMGTADIPIVSIAAPGFVPAIDFSDHRNYWNAGWPALMITDTSFLRNPHYHKSTDTPDTLDYRRMSEVVRMVHAGLLEYAKTAPRTQD
ncbi:MAG TPA: M28 family peptidase [Lacunisphaera sp.]|nr:M28 family peptidase [Lacunisphaera sp.]